MLGTLVGAREMGAEFHDKLELRVLEINLQCLLALAYLGHQHNYGPPDLVNAYRDLAPICLVIDGKYRCSARGNRKCRTMTQYFKPNNLRKHTEALAQQGADIEFYDSPTNNVCYTECKRKMFRGGKLTIPQYLLATQILENSTAQK